MEILNNPVRLILRLHVRVAAAVAAPTWRGKAGVVSFLLFLISR